jgi:methylated-DNA-[protein]-cysteine S-methyltransferase
MTLRHGTLPSPLGELTVVTAGDRLAGLQFSDCAARLRRALERRFGGAALVAGPVPAAVAGALRAYFAGDLGALDAVEVDAGGTAFQARVWRALRRIPPGTTAAYRDLARRIGAPGAVRAVGAANGANPVGLVLPCHRVIGADGALHGYAGGVARKRWLLRHEGAIA